MVATNRDAAPFTLRDLLDELDPRCRERLRMEFRAASRRARKRKLRTRVEFAQQEIYLPEGPHKGDPLLREYQPFAIDLLEQMDATSLRRFAITGCVQSGKTLIGLVVNLLWHLFERGHTVIYGVPELKMAKKKWEKEILPVIKANPRFRRLLPDTGSGSKGGFDGTIEFKNGATLEFMGATGNDSRRSSSTAQVLMKTEVDRYDEAGKLSREASPAVTMEDRVGAFAKDAYIYEECTRTTTKGRINVVVNAGTAHTTHAPCPHCGEFVHPTREHFVGFEDAADVEEAKQLATFVCPNCAAIIDEDDREWMIDRLISIPRTMHAIAGSDGSATLEGELPKTDTFSYQWNAFFNRFWTVDYLAEVEWKTLTGQSDSEDDEKQWKQKRWSIPVEPTEIDLDPLSVQDVYERHSSLPRRIAPDDTFCVTAGVDVRKTQLHYVLVAWRANGSGHIADYGVWDVDWREHGLDEAIQRAMVELAEARFAPGVRTAGAEGNAVRVIPVGFKLHDLSWMTESVQAGLSRINSKGIRRARGVRGRGQSEPPGQGSYRQPTELTDRKIWIGRQCYIQVNEHNRDHEVYANSDEWKSFVRRGLGAETPAGQTGSLTAWKPETADEKKLAREFGKQMIVETCKRVFVARRGEVDVWEHLSSAANHWFDALYYACVAACLEKVSFSRKTKRPANVQNQVATQPVVTGATT